MTANNEVGPQGADPKRVNRRGRSSTLVIDIGFYVAIFFATVAMVSSFAYIYLFFKTSSEAADKYIVDYTGLLESSACKEAHEKNDAGLSSSNVKQSDQQTSSNVAQPPQEPERGSEAHSFTVPMPDIPPIQMEISALKGQLEALKGPLEALKGPLEALKGQLEEEQKEREGFVKEIKKLHSADHQRNRQLDVMAFVSIGLSARLTMAGICLNSCGLLAGVSFAFLGFALFLVGIKGDMDMEAEGEKWNVKVARMSPGAFAIFCATVLICVAVIDRSEFRFTLPHHTLPDSSSSPQETQAPSGKAIGESKGEAAAT